MIEIDRHIEILLLSNDCVIVPGLGGFMTHRVDARYDERDATFLPPIRTLGFNPQLTLNDSLLVQSYIEAYDLSYPEALRRIESEVAELRQHIETEGQYELSSIGTLSLSDEGHLLFEPCEAGILTPDYYGLGSFAMTRLSDVAEAADSQTDTDASALARGTTPTEGAITIKMSWLRNAVAVAAAVIAFLMIGTPVSNSHKASHVEQSAIISLPASHGSATPATQTAETSEPTESSEDSEFSESSEDLPEFFETDSYSIVMASQVSQRNAEHFVSQLEQKGYYEAAIKVSATGVRRVVYGSYATEADALAAQRQLRSESKLFRDTWVMELK